MFGEREKIENIVKQKYKNEEILLELLVKYIERILDIINQNSSKEYLITYGYIIAKSLSYGKGFCSLIYDNLIIESGALLRPLLEGYELMIYLQKFPDKIKDISNGIKISAGDVAKAIDATSKSFRDYLNKNSSHLSVYDEVVRFVIDESQNKIIYKGGFSEESIKKNLSVASMLLYYLAAEAGKIIAMYSLWDRDGFELLEKMKKQIEESYSINLA